MFDASSLNPWSGIADSAAKVLTAPPAGPSRSGDIGGSGGIAPVTIATAGSKASAAVASVPVWVWIAAAVGVVLLALRKK